MIANLLDITQVLENTKRLELKNVSIICGNDTIDMIKYNYESTRLVHKKQTQNVTRSLKKNIIL